MNAFFLAGIFEDEHIRVICWTLIHSLWIGLIAAVLAGVTVGLYPKIVFTASLPLAMRLFDCLCSDYRFCFLQGKWIGWSG
jgi:hypothetical protein